MITQGAPVGANKYILIYNTDNFKVDNLSQLGREVKRVGRGELVEEGINQLIATAGLPLSLPASPLGLLRIYGNNL